MTLIYIYDVILIAILYVSVVHDIAFIQYASLIRTTFLSKELFVCEFVANISCKLSGKICYICTEMPK